MGMGSKEILQVVELFSNELLGNMVLGLVDTQIILMSL